MTDALREKLIDAGRVLVDGEEIGSGNEQISRSGQIEVLAYRGVAIRTVGGRH